MPRGVALCDGVRVAADVFEVAVDRRGAERDRRRRADRACARRARRRGLRRGDAWVDLARLRDCGDRLLAAVGERQSRVLRVHRATIACARSRWRSSSSTARRRRSFSTHLGTIGSPAMSACSVAQLERRVAEAAELLAEHRLASAGYFCARSSGLSQSTVDVVRRRRRT